jgi:hypothetical protein
MNLRTGLGSVVRRYLNAPLTPSENAAITIEIAAITRAAMAILFA